MGCFAAHYTSISGPPIGEVGGTLVTCQDRQVHKMVQGYPWRYGKYLPAAFLGAQGRILVQEKAGGGSVTDCRGRAGILEGEVRCLSRR